MSPFLVAARKENDTTDAFFAALYSELHRLAHRQLARQSGADNLSTTTLLHKAYLDMAGQRDTCYPDHSRFMGYAARVMRGLVIDHVRNRRAQKRGAGYEPAALSFDPAPEAGADRELILISDALDELSDVDASLAELVDLRFFSGFSCAEIAAVRNVSERTVQRDWEKARIYLHCSIRR